MTAKSSEDRLIKCGRCLYIIATTTYVGQVVPLPRRCPACGASLDPTRIISTDVLNSTTKTELFKCKRFRGYKAYKRGLKV